MKEFRERLKLTMQLRGMTQRELAEKTGLTEASISRYVSGQRVPNAESLMKICEALMIYSDYFLFGMGGAIMRRKLNRIFGRGGINQ